MYSFAIESAAFLLTRLLRGVTFSWRPIQGNSLISTHTPLARRDTNAKTEITSHVKFLLTRLLRGVTFNTDGFIRPRQFLLTRLLRGVTHQTGEDFWPRQFLLTRLLRGVTSADRI